MMSDVVSCVYDVEIINPLEGTVISIVLVMETFTFLMVALSIFMNVNATRLYRLEE